MMNSINNLLVSEQPFGTKFDYAFYSDILGVFHNIKKIAKLEPLSKNEIAPILFFLDKLGLKYIEIERGEVFDEKGMVFNKKDEIEEGIDLFVSKENKYLDIVTKIYNTPKSKKSELFIGKLLGYPDCCIKSFLSNSYINDKIYDNYLNDRTIGNFDWRLNNTLSIYRLIPFFPCTYNCEEAINYAQKQFEIMPNNHILFKLLNSLVLYDNFWNYIALIGGKIENNLLVFDEIFISDKNENKKIKSYIDDKKYIIEGEYIKLGNINYRIFNFNTEK